MYNYNYISTVPYTSILSGILSDFVTEKRTIGYKYISEANILHNLDALAVQDGLREKELPRNLVEKFLMYRNGESDKSVSNRAVIARQLAKYMLAHDMQAYVAPPFPKKLASAFVPHIYTTDELQRLFSAADNCPVFTNCPNRRQVMSLLLRILYGCGLRISEALNLTIKDVDVQQGILTVWNGKNEISRYIPMSPELVVRCRIFMDKVHPVPAPDDFFLPAPGGDRYSHRAIHNTFRQLLILAHISYGGKGKGPRIHDIRHTFAVHCLKKWVLAERELTNALPILAKYMGHTSFASTQYYLRLTADMFPQLTETLERKYGDIIPMLGGVFVEND